MIVGLSESLGFRLGFRACSSRELEFSASRLWLPPLPFIYMRAALKQGEGLQKFGLQDLCCRASILVLVQNCSQLRVSAAWGLESLTCVGPKLSRV